MARPVRPLLAALAAALLLALLAPPAAAHAAPPPRAFETRVLHDHNDDSLVVLAGKHGFDAIALDVREAALPTGEDVLVLRLLLNGGCNAELPTPCPTLRHLVRFDGPAGPAEVTLETADGGATWTGSAARFAGPEPLNDGTRFAIEAWVPLASFGGAAGDALGSWFVEGFAGEDPGDDMPAGAVPGAPDPLGAAFDIGSYTLGRREYVRLEAGGPGANATATGPAGATVEVPLTVANLAPLEQAAAFNVSGPATLLADGAPVTGVALAPNFTASLVLRVTLPDGTAPVEVRVATPLGGFDRITVQATGAAPQPTGNVTAGGDDHDDHDEEKDTPGPGLLLAAALLGVAALRRRRR